MGLTILVTFSPAYAALKWKRWNVSSVANLPARARKLASWLERGSFDVIEGNSGSRAGGAGMAAPGQGRQWLVADVPAGVPPASEITPPFRDLRFVPQMVIALRVTGTRCLIVVLYFSSW